MSLANRVPTVDLSPIRAMSYTGCKTPASRISPHVRSDGRGSAPKATPPRTALMRGFGHKCGSKRRFRTQMLRIRKVSTESARRTPLRALRARFARVPSELRSAVHSDGRAWNFCLFCATYAAARFGRSYAWLLIASGVSLEIAH